MDQHVSAATDVAGYGIHDRESEAGRNGGVNSITALLQDGEGGVGGVVVDAYDHRVVGGDGSFGLSEESGSEK